MMSTASEKRRKLGDLRHQPAMMLAVFLKCSVCVLLLVLLLVIGMQAPEMPVDKGQLAAGSFQQGLPNLLYAK
jgi:hypothetical protein